MTDGENTEWRDPRRGWKFWLLLFTWMPVWLWLKGQADYPDSFYEHIDRHGKADLIDELWHSYLLLGRPGYFEVALFVWIWGLVAFGAGWLVWLGWQDARKRRSRKSAHDKPPEPNGSGDSSQL